MLLNFVLKLKLKGLYLFLMSKRMTKCKYCGKTKYAMLRIQDFKT